MMLSPTCRRWRDSKYKLLKQFWEAVCGRPENEKNQQEKGLVIDVLSPIVEQKHIPHYLLVMFWAAHGNATPVKIIKSITIF